MTRPALILAAHALTMVMMTMVTIMVSGHALADTPAHVVRVVDGDTIRVEAEVWPDVHVRSLVRVHGVDAPELRGKCDDEKRRAEQARDFVAAVVGDEVMLADVQHDKFAGRVVARVLLPDGSDLAVLLIAGEHARPYDGGKREGWCGP